MVSIEPQKIMAKLTPMMEQYQEIKAEAKDAILFFRLGDFYEMFGQDAHEASKILDITLTARNKDESAVPMCGIPYHAAENYIAKLVKAGKKVAICEQISDPALPGIVKRKIVKIITPGTAILDQVLDQKSNRYILSIYAKKDYFGIAFCDVSTGEFQAAELSGAEALRNEILRINPAEIILERDQYDDPSLRTLAISISDATISQISLYEDAYKFLLDSFHVKSLEGFGVSAWPFAIEAAGILMRYIQETQKDEAKHIDRIHAYHRNNWMYLDEGTIRNLELFSTMRNKDEEGSLLSVIDNTISSMGGRMLRKWLLRPLIHKEPIQSRHDAVENFISDENLRNKFKDILLGLSDIERILGRLSSSSANARDLLSLGNSLSQIPKIQQVFSTATSSQLISLAKDLLQLEKLCQTIASSISEEPGIKTTEGDIIKDGYNSELDALRHLMRAGKTALKEIEQKEIEFTKINSLKVSYNRVFGYYIEISRVHLEKVPEHYIRKQTLANAERFITPELKEYEEKVLSAEEKSFKLEYEIFQDLKSQTLEYIKEIKQDAQIIAELDALLSFAITAIKRDYVKPTFADAQMLVKDGRHPVVESITFENSFVPNDANFKKNETELKLITGPNMSGKSTYLRQIALIALLNQIGSFVPAKAASLPLFDRIFTRVGASDNLVRGQSTFMVEMQESAYILNHATAKSLIILDEIGRGTSTYDGLSIAWSILEFLHDKIGAFTLFATHYHELINVVQNLPKAKNYCVDVKESEKGVLFLHKIIEGGIDKSYGIEVAKLAGVPTAVIDRSAEILTDLEAEKIQSQPKKIPENQMGLFTGKYIAERHPVLERLKGIDINDLTPIEALIALSELKKL